MPDRHGPLRTGMGQFVEHGNDGLVSHGAVVVSAGDVGLTELPLSMLAGTPTAKGDLVSVVAPGGLTEGKAIKIEFSTGLPLERAMVLIPGEAVATDELAPATDGPVGVDHVVGLTDFLPVESWTPGSVDGGVPGQGWLTQRAAIEKIEIAVEKVERARSVLVSTGGRPWEEVFGTAAEFSTRSPESGETFDPSRTLLAVPGDVLVDAWPESEPAPPERLTFEGVVPRPAPMAGVSFGVAVLSTPSAKVAGNPANPLSYIDTDAILARSEVQRLLTQAGFGEDTAIDIAAGPERVTPEAGPQTTTLLDTEAEIESYVGVLGGEAAGWGVGLHVVRADTEDHVIVVGLHRHPIGPVEGAIDALRESSAIVEARTLVAETARQLTAR